MQVNGDLLLANFLEIVVNELWEKRLQYIKRIQAENIWRETDCLDKVEKYFLPIYWAAKKLIILYSHRKELIFWVLKVFLRKQM